MGTQYQIYKIVAIDYVGCIMQTLARIFGRSPFAPLMTHMEKVSLCVSEVPLLFEALAQGEFEKMPELAKWLSKLEHEADLTKNDIRNNLPTGLFLPIARGSLLEILSLQDSIADVSENIAVLLTFRKLEILPLFADSFDQFIKKNIEAFNAVHEIIREMHALLESSFGGIEAEKVKQLVDAVAFKEHEADILQHALLEIFFRECDAMPTPLFYLWMKVIGEVGAISDVAEKLANRVRMTLEVKS